MSDVGNPFPSAPGHFVIPQEMLKDMAVYYTNAIQLSFTGDAVGLVFCNRVSTMGGPIESEIAVPQAEVFMGVLQAEQLAKGLLKGVEELKRRMEQAGELVKSNV